MALMVSKANMRRFQMHLNTVNPDTLKIVIESLQELDSKKQLELDERNFLADCKAELERREIK